jgi:glucose/arabinose dehydrogenase
MAIAATPDRLVTGAGGYTGAVRIPRTRAVLQAAMLLGCLLALAACGATDDDGDGDSGGSSGPRERDVPRVRLEQVGAFDRPVHVVAVPGSDLAAVVEQGGRVLVVDGLRCTGPDACPARPVRGGTTMLDLRGKVSTGNEQGLLGLAFHPDWPDDPRVFIDYTDPGGDTHVEAWELDTPTGHARRQRELLRIDQPFENHNGGHVLFGPDGLLYVGMGDGGSAGDPGDRAQQPDELLGKLLRLDVDGGGERGYAIPPGNLEGGAPEVWALGLRNPWRFSFDSKTGDLWIGDVGQDEREEIDALEHGELDDPKVPNFGWRRSEGFQEFDRSGRTGPGRIVDPVLDYGRDDGCSVTGGIVYRGRMVEALRGWYVFADFCGDDLRLLDASGVPGSQPKRGDVTWASVPGMPQIASFAQVQHDELLVVSLDGRISQVVPA